MFSLYTIINSDIINYLIFNEQLVNSLLNIWGIILCNPAIVCKEYFSKILQILKYIMLIIYIQILLKILDKYYKFSNTTYFSKTV